MVQGFIDQFFLTWRLLKDPRVPAWAKAIPILAVLYVFSPVDFIPDFVLGLGQLDDIGILLASMRLFETVSPNHVVREHRGQLERQHK